MTEKRIDENLLYWRNGKKLRISGQRAFWVSKLWTAIGVNMYLLIKTLITAIVVVGISELGKKFSLIGGVLASLPLTSILAFVWLFQDTKDIDKIVELSNIIFWMVVPSLFFFLCFPWFLKQGWRFYPSLATSAVLMVGVYSIYIIVMKKMGVKL